MRLRSTNGLTLVELIVVMAILLFLASSIKVCPSIAVMHASMTAVGVRGKDIWVAVTGTNQERAALGLQPIWPRDFDPVVDTNATELDRLDFGNSTDYFRWLYENHRSITNGVGFDYSRLAGAGVSACSDDKRLSAANNMWIVAKNVRDDMGDIVPILVTRNIDASSLAARVGEQDSNEKALRFDSSWKAPFRDKGFVMIRKGGAIFQARRKFTTYRIVYAGQVFDTALTTNGVAAPPLKYLTPMREITPGERAYAEGAAIVYPSAGGWRGQFRREWPDFRAGVTGTGLFFAVLYLPFFAYYTTWRKKRGLRPQPAAPVLGGWACHYLSVVFYVDALFKSEVVWLWAFVGVAAAVGAQAAGIALAFALPKQDREARLRQVLWLLLVPLQLGVLFAFLSLCCGGIR